MNNIRPTLASRHLTWLAVAFLGVMLYRLVQVFWFPHLPNFSPLMPLAFCAGLLLPFRLAVGLVLIPLAFSDAILNFFYGVPILSGGGLVRLLCYLLALGFGAALRGKSWSLPIVFGFTLTNAVIFYLATNTAAWLASPAYIKSSAGWWQAITVGTPGFPPTWMFFRNSLAGDVIFTALILGAYFLAVRSGRRAAIPGQAA